MGFKRDKTLKVTAQVKILIKANKTALIEDSLGLQAPFQ